MTNLNEVLEFIKNSEKSELKSIYNAYAIRMSEIRHEEKESFRVGDIVGINHKKMDPKQNFRVIKINSKNIKVQASDVGDGRIGGMYTVSPGLLVKR
tara:strand:+ start:2662 stop:2952 length:291 start_codon:yes stop_codon:yes gene_type:complete